MREWEGKYPGLRLGKAAVLALIMADGAAGGARPTNGR